MSFSLFLLNIYIILNEDSKREKTVKMEMEGQNPGFDPRVRPQERNMGLPLQPEFLSAQTRSQGNRL